MTTNRVGHKVLILAGDPMLAALLGGLVELARFEPAFAVAGERPVDALARVKPVAAVILDGQDEESENDLFIARARKRDVAVFLFGTAVLVTKRRSWAETQGISLFELPRQVAELEIALHDLREPVEKKKRSANRRAHTERDQDGTLIFDDGEGTRWSVYDRRGPERRQSVDRQFVNESGTVMHCDVSEDEAASTSVATLTAQLARATPLPTATKG